jgi:hypothetical protein
MRNPIFVNLPSLEELKAARAMSRAESCEIGLLVREA